MSSAMGVRRLTGMNSEAIRAKTQSAIAKTALQAPEWTAEGCAAAMPPRGAVDTREVMGFVRWADLHFRPPIAIELAGKPLKDWQATLADHWHPPSGYPMPINELRSITTFAKTAE